MAKYAAARAHVGDPYPLIGRFLYALQRRDAPLSNDEIMFIRKALEATANKKTDTAGLGRLEEELIARQVDGLIDNDGYKPKDAKKVVALDRGCSLRHIATALSKYGIPRRHRD